MKVPLKIALLGCGNRGRVYANLIAEQPENFQIVAAADPITERVAAVKAIANSPTFSSFTSADALLDVPKLADVLLVATQDKYHFAPGLKALKKGYDLVLEKPMSTNLREIIALEDVASRLGRRIIVCHVLRYTSFYQKLREIVQSGQLGDLISINASEGIEPWHFAHSYVRGHWSIMEKSSPTIVAKCCHDMDILHWIIGKKCERISSFGSLSFFKKENAHLEAEYPTFDMGKYLEPQRKIWLAQICDRPNTSNAELLKWLKKSPWGRSVFACNNTAIDHQVLNLEFEEGITATFTMNAFDEGRNYEITGTKARLRAGDFYREHVGADIIMTEHAGRHVHTTKVVDQNPHPKYGGYHNGGDVGFVKSLHSVLTSPSAPLTSVTASMHSHLMAFAAEEARITQQLIDLEDFLQQHQEAAYALD